MAQGSSDVFFYDFDGRLAASAHQTTEEELLDKFGWKAVGSAANYANLSRLQEQWVTAQYRTEFTTEVAEDDPSVTRVVQMAGPSGAWTSVALSDCEGRLLFVLRLQRSTARFPGAADVFDRTGALLAHSLVESRRARQLFVDSQGYLLATAGAPTLNSTASFEDLPRDPAAGGLVGYELKLEEGGYANASGLLDVDYRWVLAAALQLRDLADGRAYWAPGLPEAWPVFYWAAATLLTGIFALACFCAYRPVHASGKPNDRSALLQWKPRQRVI